jgi:hypothetical protein
MRLDLAGVRTLGLPCSIGAGGKVLCRRFVKQDIAPDAEVDPVAFDLCPRPRP